MHETGKAQNVRPHPPAADFLPWRFSGNHGVYQGTGGGRPRAGQYKAEDDAS